ncbi:HCNGP-like protein-domain-containing protein [Cercophora newfieldiana]|uniref:HCNGP-like protein-domain-containing protein n=1 Tax=Cercophora newfieldiana TaxID=92897 RepID=A0AA39YQM5_9PEZI|nr:HCNGP-like protein-domain-containing protein [Cercophora newfieldiana]
MAFLSEPGAADSDPPRSPYSTARALARDLTLPAVPDMAIPPSPPPTQHADMTSLNAKFDTFLKLKRRAADPAHFNSRIGASSALRNPALMDKLLGFVGMETEFSEGDAAGTAQYGTTVGSDVWDPAGFPEWAYRGALRRAQERGTRERERARGEPVQFVSSGAGAGVEAAGAAPVRFDRRTMFDT